MSTSLDERKLAIIRIMIKEREELRNEIIALMKGLVNVGLFFLPVVATTLGLLVSNDLVRTDTENMLIKSSYFSIIIFVLSQLEYFLGIMAMIMLCSMSVHAGYIRAMSKKINSYAEEIVTLWEAEMVPNFVFGPRATFFWLSVTVYALALVSFVYLVIKSTMVFNPFISGIIFTVEIILGIIFIIFTLKEGERSYRHAMKKFDLETLI